MAVVGRGSDCKEKTSTVRAIISCNRLVEIINSLGRFRRILKYLVHVDGMYGTFSELVFI